MHADRALRAALSLPGVDTVLDIGSGAGNHAHEFRRARKLVTTVNLYPPADYVCDYLDARCMPHDLVWASHVLEHQRNPGAFLDKVRRDLKPGGWFVVTVPPLKREIVGGHVSLWNAGLLLYHLILAGFNCREAAVASYGYNVSVIVRNVPVKQPWLAHDEGDIERLAEFFPNAAHQGFNGDIERLNWSWP